MRQKEILAKKRQKCNVLPVEFYQSLREDILEEHGTMRNVELDTADADSTESTSLLPQENSKI